MIERITILGGSSVYIPELVLSLISHNVNVREIVLQGREGKKLPLVAQFCQRLLDRSGFPAKVTHAVSAEEAVEGSRYVINHIRVGGMQARLRDEKLPAKHHMIGGESIGAGGFANAMRTLPVVLDYAKRVERVSPDATFINLTSPNGVIVEALTRFTNLRVLGVCGLPARFIKTVAALLQQDVSMLDVDYIGLNKMGWIQDVKVSGRSQMTAVLEQLENGSEDGLDCDLINLFRLIPTTTMALYFHQDAVLKRQSACTQSRAETLYAAERRILRLYEDKNLCEVPELARARNAVWYEETIVPLIEAMEGKGERQFVLCVRNDGAIRDLPDKCSVEVPVRVDNQSAKPRRVGNCPRFVKGLFMEVKESDRLTVEAVCHRSYECALQALTVHPLVPSLEVARKYLDRIVKEDHLELH